MNKFKEGTKYPVYLSGCDVCGAKAVPWFIYVYTTWQKMAMVCPRCNNLYGVERRTK